MFETRFMLDCVSPKSCIITVKKAYSTRCEHQRMFVVDLISDSQLFFSSKQTHAVNCSITKGCLTYDDLAATTPILY